MSTAERMLQFKCPHCQSLLNIPNTYLGMSGRCNKCGGHIALLGRADTGEPQMASAAEDVPVQDIPSQPATTKQLEYLHTLGASPERLAGITREAASDLIEHFKNKRQESAPPTKKQRDYLRRLGASEKQVTDLHSKAEASALIEEMHLHPTGAQREFLKQLGATGAQIAALKSRGEASALIDRLQEDQGD